MGSAVRRLSGWFILGGRDETACTGDQKVIELVGYIIMHACTARIASGWGHCVLMVRMELQARVHIKIRSTLNAPPVELYVRTIPIGVGHVELSPNDT